MIDLLMFGILIYLALEVDKLRRRIAALEGAEMQENSSELEENPPGAGPEIAPEAADLVSGLSGRELDAAVAERVMGWHRQTDYDYNPPQVDWYDAEGNFKAHVNCEEQLPSLSTWSPSSGNGIAAAMEVVEKMRERGWSFACTMYHGKLPYASFCKGTAASSRNAEAALLPEAICRAALEATKGQ